MRTRTNAVSAHHFLVRCGQEEQEDKLNTPRVVCGAFLAGTFVTEGTHPRGSEWARIPIPSIALGACCIAGPHDTATTPNRCLPGEGTYCKAGAPCKPCPQTPGSDCSRCDNHPPPTGSVYKPAGVTAFPPQVPSAAVRKKENGFVCVSTFDQPIIVIVLPRQARDRHVRSQQLKKRRTRRLFSFVQGCDHKHAIRDVLRIPADLPAGEYVLGWRYDCEATAQVWSNCEWCFLQVLTAVVS